MTAAEYNISTYHPLTLVHINKFDAGISRHLVRKCTGDVGILEVVHDRCPLEVNLLVLGLDLPSILWYTLVT